VTIVNDESETEDHRRVVRGWGNVTLWMGGGGDITLRWGWATRSFEKKEEGRGSRGGHKK
jgi:hypothetical protein